MSEIQDKRLDEGHASLDSLDNTSEELFANELNGQALAEHVIGEKDELLSDMSVIITKSQSLLARLNQGDERSDTEWARELLKQTMEVASYLKVSGERLYAAALSFIDEEQGELHQLIESAEGELLQRAWVSRWAELRSMIARTFPVKIPEVNLSRTPWAEAGVSVPAVGAWQRKMNISDDAIADDLYRGHTADARKWALISVETFGLEQMPDKDTVESYRRYIDTSDEPAKPGLDLIRYCVALKELRAGIAEHIERAEVPYQRNGEPGSMWIRFINPGVVGYANELMQKIDALLVGGSRQEQFAHFAQLASESQSSLLKRVAVDIADERCSHLMENVLSQLSIMLDKTSPELEGVRHQHELPVAEGVQGPASVAPAVADSDVASEQYQHIDTVNMPHEALPWLEGEDQVRTVLMDVTGANGRVLVLDCESQEAKDVAQSSSYDAEYEKSKLEYAANMIATSRDGRLANMKHVRNQSRTQYPYPVMYFNPDTSNAMRLYVAQVPVGYLERIVPGKYDELTRLGVHSILAHIGTCDKANQNALLSQLTGKSARSVRASGGGSI